MRGRDELFAMTRALVDLAPDVVFRLDHVLAFDDRRALSVARWVGTRDGGPFEIPFVHVHVLGEDGRVERLHIYDLDQLDEARACFAALRPDALRIPPNAVTRARDRLHDACEAQDWDAVRALFAPAVLYDDRRRGILTTGDREMYLASLQHAFSRGRTRVVRTVLATAGDRLTLERDLWTAAGDASPFEIETLSIHEVDAEGCFVACITFDPDDRRAASAEMLERWARSDAARGIPAAVFETFRAINAHDLDRVRAALHDDFVYHDHRRTGLGRIERVGDYVASLRPLFEGKRDFSTDDLYYVAAEEHGSLAIGRTFGTLAEGGEFESVFARLILYRDGRMGAVEQFELEHLDLARARFEELRSRASPSASSDRTKARGAP
jgi:ketosteroid isomerase-like protein